MSRAFVLTLPEPLTPEQVEEFCAAWEKAIASCETLPLLVHPDLIATDGAQEVLVERAKQREKFGDAHDDTEHVGALPHVAAFLAAGGGRTDVFAEWAAWDVEGWAVNLLDKHNQRDRLVIAAALLIAEIDRQDRETNRALDAVVQDTLGPAVTVPSVPIFLAEGYICGERIGWYVADQDGPFVGPRHGEPWTREAIQGLQGRKVMNPHDGTYVIEVVEVAGRLLARLQPDTGGAS